MSDDDEYNLYNILCTQPEEGIIYTSPDVTEEYISSLLELSLESLKLSEMKKIVRYYHIVIRHYGGDARTKLDYLRNLKDLRDSLG